MKVSPHALTFRSNEGEIILWNGRYTTSVYFSPHGTDFFKLHITGAALGTRPIEILDVEDPHHNTSGILQYDNDAEILTWEDKTFTKIENPCEVTVVTLPDVRVVEYLYQLPDGRYIYVSASRYNYSYESMKLFVGSGESMLEIPITDVHRLRDGGTTYIETPENGVFYFPPPQPKGATGNWNSAEIQPLEESQFIITETPEGVTILPR